MRVLIHDACLDTQQIAVVRDGDHDVTIANDEAGVRAAFSGGGPHVALINVATDLTMLKLVRSLADARGTHVVAVTSESAEDHLTTAYDAGADSCMCARVGARHLQARVRALQRILRLGTPPASEIPGPPTLESMISSSTVGRSRAMLQDAIGQMLGLPVELAPLERARTPLTCASSIMLSSAAHQLEMRAAIGCDAQSAQMLVTHLFGEMDDSLAADMVSELANLMMGTLKTSFANEGLPLTAGLPSTIPSTQLLQPTTVFWHQDVFTLVIQSATLVIHLGVGSKANVFCVHAELRDGMVLAKDVFNARGLLLLDGGTRLSLNMIERLARSIDPKLRIEVLAP